MSTQGKAAKSSSGASMSKYDVEVESRLQKLEAEAHNKPTGATEAKVEARLSALEAKKNTSSKGECCAALEAKVENLIAILNKSSSVTEHCPKNAEGVRQINL
jgi:hypothetical protein